MTFIDHFFDLFFGQHKDGPPLAIEVHKTQLVATPRATMATQIAQARGSLRKRCQPGDRAVLIADNSARWIAADMAMLFEGLIVVPMYARQDPAELVQMMHDCTPSVVVVGTDELAQAIVEHWPKAPTMVFDDLFAGEAITDAPVSRSDDDAITLVYTSGTSGPAKGVITSQSNVDFMLPTTADALAAMMGDKTGPDHVFHYLPFCFAGSRIVLWTCMHRNTAIRISTDLDNLLEEISTAEPHYFLNVPMLLERIKTGVESNVRSQAALVQRLYDRARKAHKRSQQGTLGLRDKLALKLADVAIFNKVRAKVGPELRALICGSAPLSEDTQAWFQMLQIPVYQVYGLTETTAIVTMDRPPKVRAGRVGPLIKGIEAKISAEGELLVKGPNIFQGYYNRPEATEAAFEDGWFKTGDQAEIDVADGTFHIVGRLKNLLIPTSGHNVAPEPIEQLLLAAEGVEQAVLVGHGRKSIGALITGTIDANSLQAHVDEVNAKLPHYRRVRHLHQCAEPFTIENGLLTANRKLRRRAIEQAYREQIDALYS